MTRHDMNCLLEDVPASASRISARRLAGARFFPSFRAGSVNDCGLSPRCKRQACLDRVRPRSFTLPALKVPADGAASMTVIARENHHDVPTPVGGSQTAAGPLPTQPLQDTAAPGRGRWLPGQL